MARFGRRLPLLAAGIAMAYLAFSPLERSLATSFRVDSTIDAVDANPGDGVCATAAGQCTLRAAIQETNALPGPDTIELPAGTYTVTAAADNEPDGNGDLNIRDQFEIRGAGTDQTFIDGGRFARLGSRTFEVRAATAVISNLTIMNGGLNLILGGAILNNGGTLTLNDVVIKHDVAYSGAGIANLGLSTLTVNGGAFIENGGPGSQSSDGAISNEGTMTLDRVTFRGNSSGLGAGAIGNYNTATLHNVTIADNATDGAGGGIYNGFEMTLTNSAITGNHGGSGIYNDVTGTLRS